MSSNQEYFDQQYSSLRKIQKIVLEQLLRGMSDDEIREYLDRTGEGKVVSNTVRTYVSEICDFLLGDRDSAKSREARRHLLFVEIAKYKPELICKAWPNFKIVLDGDLKKLSDTDKKELQNEIKQLAEKYELKILHIKSGSIILEFEGSPEGFERIKALFDSGELTEIAGFAIQEISALPEQQTQRTQLREWLQGVFAPLWESVDGLFTTDQPSFAFRQRSEGVSRRKTIVFNELEDRQVELVATIIPLERPKVKVIVQILPSPESSHLPEDLRIQLLDESDADTPEGEVFDAKENLEFNLEVGDAFSIIVEQGRYRVVERFMV